MTYDIGHVIMGTYLPWDEEVNKNVGLAYIASEPTTFVDEEKIEASEINALVDALHTEVVNGDISWLDVVGERDGWIEEYHGASDGLCPVAWVGVELGQFDSSDHLPLTKITSMVPLGRKRDEVTNLARDRYEKIPKDVRDVLPPFDIYIVWSSS